MSGHRAFLMPDFSAVFLRRIRITAGEDPAPARRSMKKGQDPSVLPALFGRNVCPARSLRALSSLLPLLFGRGLLLVGVGVGLQQLVLHVGRNLLVGGEFHRVGRRPRRER